VAKKQQIARVAKLQFNAGKAKPGPELAGLGINMPGFTKEFNDKTKDRNGEPVPVVITVYKDKSFSFETKTAPTSFKLLQAAGLKSGSANSKTTIAGKISDKQLEEIAKYKMVDLNTNKLESAKNQVAGTAKNMGILIEGRDNIAEAEEAAKEAGIANKLAEAREAQLDAEAAEAVEAAQQKDQELEIETTVQSNDEKEAGEK
jgi:large subunit ribosomal protein L11